MVISLVFSVGIYRVSSQELGRTIVNKQGPVERIIRTRDAAAIIEFRAELQQAVADAEARLKTNLLLLNTLIFVAGGLLSYVLARRTLKPIEQAHHAQSRFTADASHELRTPITAMRAETELALTEPKLTLKQAKQQLVSNLEELDKLTALSNGLLSLARLDNNGLKTSSVNLSAIVDTAIERVKPLAEAKNQLIKKPKISKITIMADKALLVDAVVTLLDNAVKYSPKKSQITVTVKTQSKTVNINIKDQGVGIKASDLPHIFDRFYRADQSRNKTQIAGYGIGLSIAAATLQAHGGKITAVSTPGKGSTFTIQFPLR